MREIRLGIIGVGAFGRFTLEQYRKLPEARITAIAGTKQDKYAALAREFNVPFHTTDWRELVTHPEVDVVYLATPPDTRATMTLAALHAGKHVFCEKPLALSLVEADAMLANAARYGLRLGINFVMRYAKLYMLLGTLLREHLLGEAQQVIFLNAAGDLEHGHWFWDRTRSGGILVEHGVHFFDIFASMLGEGTVPNALVTRRSSGEADRWNCTVLYNKQIFANFTHAFDKPSPIEHTLAVIDTTLATITLVGWLPTALRLDGLVHVDALPRLTELLPDLIIDPLSEPMKVLADGQPHPVTHRLHGEINLAEKQAVYARAVSDAMADFLAWVRDPAHRPRVTAVEGRAALATALTARALAEGMADSGLK